MAAKREEMYSALIPKNADGGSSSTLGAAEDVEIEREGIGKASLTSSVGCVYFILLCLSRCGDVFCRLIEL
jgi:hypothetical protein